MFIQLLSKRDQKSRYMIVMIVNTKITMTQLSSLKFPIRAYRSLYTGPSEVLEYIHSCRRTKRIYQLSPLARHVNEPKKSGVFYSRRFRKAIANG